VKCDFNSFFNLLIVNPIDHDSYEAVAVLNYFNFPMEVNEDGYKSFVRKEMGFS
jgi:adenine C2-methylase RlmN of 23S rRNA A2503 and tRNA A37